jgi:hypothetical protein
MPSIMASILLGSESGFAGLPMDSGFFMYLFSSKALQRYARRESNCFLGSSRVPMVRSILERMRAFLVFRLHIKCM